ncbi:MAG: tetratricopeptide repeat protein, partial [Gammaproteobacteria bacterium]|nr:tetratricopeptide repeat protein [Gammaproteobacteria bacterium]
AAFSPDGKAIVTASSDNTARLWDAHSGQPLHLLKGHEERVNHAAFSPDGKAVVTASSDNTVRLWDTHSGQPLHLLKGHESGVNHAAFSPDGKAIVTASNDYTARLWPVFQDRGALIARARKVLPRLLTCEEREKKYFLDFVPRCAGVEDDSIRGDDYQGDFDPETGKANGQGETAGQNRYAGGFKQGLKHGQGVYTWQSGESLQGEFAEDEFLAASGLRLPMPEHADGWMELAIKRIEKQENTAALAALTIQERLQADHSELWRVRGDVLLKAERVQEALAAYQEQLKRFPDDQTIHGKLGNAYLALSLSEGMPAFENMASLAAEAYRKQLDIAPSKLECKGREVFIFEQVRSSQCCVVSNENIQGFYQGECNSALQAHGQGKAGIENIYEGGFHNGLMHGHGIYTWEDGSRYEGEFTNDKIQGFDIPESQDGWAWIQIGAILHAQNKSEEATAAYIKASVAYRKAVETNPADDAAWGQLAHTLLAAGQTGEAAEILAQRLEKQPDNLRYLTKDAELALAQGNLERMKQRIAAARDKAGPDTQNYALHAFMTWLAAPDTDWLPVLQAARDTEAEVEFTWDLSILAPAFARLTPAQQKNAAHFRAFLEGKIDVAALKKRLEEQ